jgi:hypothetical protein
MLLCKGDFNSVFSGVVNVCEIITLRIQDFDYVAYLSVIGEPLFVSVIFEFVRKTVVDF